jgi:hypothetical protein
MRRRALFPFVAPEILQWVGLLGAALVWSAQLVVGFGTTVADCAVGSRRFGLDLHTWEIALMAAAGVLVVIAEVAAISVLLETRHLDYSDPPPWGRRYFFALAAAVGNVLFLVIILLSGIASISNSECTQG